ncbi:Predicted nucleotidyltransferase [Natribacillus halophilus]|uniref:Predicted nucleotidyltransferase n=2 Tax=Natribacillus halophilus TaxID=549003 RepID=A0A1G8Q2R6_9BACI|nr:Predicted nucleotidyltransferase [Natribacillus halophilus]
MIIKELKQRKEIKEAAIFGSRAMGNYKNGSDVDLVIYGPEVTEHVISQLRITLNEELPLPYYFDIVHYETISSDPLKEHIDSVSRSLYQPNPL